MQMQSFRYDDLPKKHVARCDHAAYAIGQLQKQIATHLIEIGQELSEVKSRLKHGQFVDWVDHHFGWSLRSAELMMSVTKRFQPLLAERDHDRCLKSFDQSALYLLAAPKTPPEAVTIAVERARAGEPITHKTAKRIVEASLAEQASSAEGADHSDTDARSESTEAAVDTGATVTTYDPKHPDARYEPTEACPVCGCYYWLTDDDGTNCDNCLHPLGEPIGDTEQDVPGVSAADVKKALSAVGVLARFFAQAGDHSHDEAIRMVKSSILKFE